jgi:hypothetical protein
LSKKRQFACKRCGVMVSKEKVFTHISSKRKDTTLTTNSWQLPSVLLCSYRTKALMRRR